MRDSSAQPQPSTTKKKPEDTKAVEIKTIEIPEPGETVDSSEGNFILDTILRNVLNDANVTMAKKRILPDYETPGVVGSLGDVATYARAAKIPVKQARKLLEKKLSYTLHKLVRRRGISAPVVVFNIDEQWVADLIDVQTLKSQNRGYRYILVVVDVLSKRAWVEPIKKKTGKTVTEAFKKIVSRAGQIPFRIQTDQGKEFFNSTIQAWCRKNENHHFVTRGDSKASIAERFIRTFKSKLYRYFTAKNTFKYVDVIQDLVTQYSYTPHRSIGMTPSDVTEDNVSKLWSCLYGPHTRSKAVFKKEDKVRLQKKFRPFKNGYLPGWTEEVFEVYKVVPGRVSTYKVQELDGTPLKGHFYARDLQKVHVNEQTYFRVEKVLKRAKDRLFVGGQIQIRQSITSDIEFDSYRGIRRKTSECIDLSRGFIEIDAGFKTDVDGNWTLRANNVKEMLCPINNLAHSLFKEINVKCNGVLLTENVDMYHYKAYIQTLLNYDRIDGDTILRPQGWRNGSCV
ncbi:putative uncharacterized transposon-derived protein F54H12.3 [Stylophora pistillata]|uniref:Uncharacterized transposon-derived protein F54H12.3 n=1 Tax=Stylophora pistillata TaxID=50429 RepID=A0A2B4SDK0_STYPI|nr:putative uncharacterized transposon-derived protein F54H12.3 [Stylophora pistillata]